MVARRTTLALATPVRLLRIRFGLPVALNLTRCWRPLHPEIALELAKASARQPAPYFFRRLRPRPLPWLQYSS
jgi:hypothetical protein